MHSLPRCPRYQPSAFVDSFVWYPCLDPSPPVEVPMLPRGDARSAPVGCDGVSCQGAVQSAPVGKQPRLEARSGQEAVGHRSLQRCFDGADSLKRDFPVVGTARMDRLLVLSLERFVNTRERRRRG